MFNVMFREQSFCTESNINSYADTDAVADCDTDTNAGGYTANCICDTGAATS